MVSKDIEPIDENYITDIRTRKGKATKKGIRNSDFLFDDDSLEEFLNKRIIKGTGDKVIKIPEEVYNNLPEAPTQWEALQEWLIKREADIIIKKISWEVSQVIETEPEPKVWVGTNEHNDELETDIRQNGLLSNEPAVFNDNKKFIGRLADFYYSVHYAAIVNGFNEYEDKFYKEIIKEHNEEILNIVEIANKQIIHMKEKNKEMAIKYKTEFNHFQNEINYLSNELEKAKKNYKSANKVIEEKNNIILSKNQQINALEITYKHRTLKAWKNYKWKTWNEK